MIFLGSLSLIMHVRAKKHLGQHFLTDPHLAQKIVESLRILNPDSRILEIGPGKGVLTQYLLAKEGNRVLAIDIDIESVEFLHNQYPSFKSQIVLGDFLEASKSLLAQDQWSIIGNFPYNISSQIIFKILENRNQVGELVGMFQKEVAERFRGKPSTKEYGILSVLVQAFFEVDYLFSVKPGSFYPPPKVNSAVVRFTRKDNFKLDCNEALFFRIIRAGFNQRRKTLRNSLLGDFPAIKNPEAPYSELRAEALSVQDFIVLCRYLEDNSKTT